MVEPFRPPGIAGWALWRLPVPAVAVVLGVEAAAVVLVVLGAGGTAVEHVAMAALLIVLSVVHTELATGIERVRRRAAETSYFDLSSVWTFAAAVLLPPLPATVVVLGVYLHLWQRVWRPAGVPLHRHLYTTATVVLAAGAAHAVVGPDGLAAHTRDPAGVATVVAAVVAYVVVNTLLVAAVIGLTGDRSAVRDLVGRWDDNAVELATICMGALAAIALDTAPGLVVLVLPPILVLHRAVLVRQLEEAASTDAKTGLLTPAAWRTRAEQVVRRTRRTRGTTAVLILDLDHFKAVNDAHGHLAGDGVLAAVAAELRAGVRQHDLVGRFGGEEFVVLLPELPAGAGGRAELAVVAERLRCRVEALEVPLEVSLPGGGYGVAVISGLSVSIGGATVPIDDADLDHVMRAADSSLYEAKREGRNLVRIAALTEVPAPRRPLL
ncbi:MAG TPA: GGDEF domain-containing protein [Pseudonocardia sp.]|nr:GGDEF domain-containing protein [Pseudonocardia sp.]